MIMRPYRIFNRSWLNKLYALQREKTEVAAKMAAAVAKRASVRADLDAQIALNASQRVAQPMSNIERQKNARLLHQIVGLQAR